jgi:hypothetical protein
VSKLAVICLLVALPILTSAGCGQHQLELGSSTNQQKKQDQIKNINALHQGDAIKKQMLAALQKSGNSGQ